MRRNIVAGNWKMHKNLNEAKDLLSKIGDYTKNHKTNCAVFVAPPALYLSAAKEILSGSGVEIYGQDMSAHESGAFTGEIAASMYASIGIEGSIIGHSERRKYHNETDESVGVKVKLALAQGLTPIYCNGETLEQRKAEKHFDVIQKQVETSLFGLSAEEIKKVVIAYEPIWAIGTGETATPEQAQEVHAFMRQLIADKYGKDVADEISILYGGSVKPGNAKEIFSQPDVDGGLIGGAALDVESFSAIIEAFN